MNYEYKRTRGGLGSMGWTGGFTSYGNRFSGRRCQTPDGQGNIICGRTQESSFMTNQGCRPVTISVPEHGDTRLCFTSPENNPGTLYCCPPGRPGTAAQPGATVTQPPAGRRDIRELQTWLNEIGCNAGTVDGAWGPITAGAVQCAERQGNATVIAAQFPWVATMRVTPTGQARPPDFTFDPGTTAKTPEQVAAAGSPGGGGGSVAHSGSTQEDIDADCRGRQAAGVLGALPWWGWAAIAVGGVAILGVVGVLAFGEDEEPMYEEEEEDEYYLPRRRY